MKTKHILVPTDFSDASIEGLKMAAHFVELYDSCVDLMHVIPLMSYYDESMEHLGVPFDMENDLYPKVLKSANEKLHEIAARHLPKEHCGKLVNKVGRKTSRVITDEANRGHYDLIIMSNKGSHQTKDVRSGVTEQVIRYSEIPVLSINTAFHEKEINNILVPVDGSDESAAPLVQAYDLAKTFSADLTLMHIIEPYTLGMEVLPMVVEDDDTVYESLITSISTYFDEHPKLGFHIKRGKEAYTDQLVHEKDGMVEAVTLKSEVKKGFSAHTEIVDYAEEHADLVVMSTHGRTGIARVLLGSTTGIVAQHLKKPLLTMRPNVKFTEEAPTSD
ncbi:universal stress protein [Gracilimonas mengyeensis]|uniref:Nucleotide-binding universal stress protein, UspA family n=1 Tax=Gracilimonas mengyeensis TaxID=1302730 RepID=A0A521BMB6_9BACT|nr:universal stress protein [Gracilimonas mengyeensis]SMO48278.1 Nucleotide-binding universal stress protein, UspA family [Gracilimonas mengyeensis]